MPRNYYCDFCQCTFPDNKTNRKNHNEGSVHVYNKKLHYDWYKDPVEFLQEQLNKPPCRFYLTQGYCEYGLNCKYSHITLDINNQPIYPPELNQLLQSQQPETPTVAKKIQRYRLPKGWKVKDLPPSLKPPPKGGYEWEVDTGYWG
ncbi:hypothetical protein BDB01DRAFT_909273 [Pilobolus umbonatus]|nr:hypothetical protein BDB01DRAFT_909273 [Pilobolus umbonatus]